MQTDNFISTTTTMMSDVHLNTKSQTAQGIPTQWKKNHRLLRVVLWKELSSGYCMIYYSLRSQTESGQYSINWQFYPLFAHVLRLDEVESSTSGQFDIGILSICLDEWKKVGSSSQTQRVVATC